MDNDTSPLTWFPRIVCAVAPPFPSVAWTSAVNASSTGTNTVKPSFESRSSAVAPPAPDRAFANACVPLTDREEVARVIAVDSLGGYGRTCR